MTKYITRQKVLVVPYVLVRNQVPYFVMVKDKRSGEWGFISGGVKRGERAEQAAQRELQEESSSLLTLPLTRCSKTHFTSLYRPPELKKIDARRNEVVRSVYSLYMYSLTDHVVTDVLAIKKYFKQFYKNDEVTHIDIRPFNEYENIWSFCRDVYHRHVKNLKKPTPKYAYHVTYIPQPCKTAIN